MPDGRYNVDGVIQRETARLRAVAEALQADLRHTNSDTAAGTPRRSGPMVWVDEGQLLCQTGRLGNDVRVVALRSDRRLVRVTSWVVSDDGAWVAVCGSTATDDQYEILAFQIDGSSGSLIMSERLVSPAIRSCGAAVLWVRRDEAHRPFEVVAWSRSGGRQRIYREDDVRFRVTLDGAAGSRALIRSRGVGVSELVLAESCCESAQIGASVVVSRETGSDSSAVLAGEQVLVLDANAQQVWSTGTDSVLPQLPADFVGTRIGVVDTVPYVEGRREGHAALWCPTWGVDALWTAPPGGAIRPAAVAADGIRLGVSSPAQPLSVILGRRDGTSDARSAAAARSEGRRLLATAIDGTEIPITLFSASTTGGKGSAPVVTIVYGCYGMPLDSIFDPLLAMLIDAGVDVALCHVRGGGELGPTWHAAGTGAGKLVSIEDYLACVEFLAELPEIDAGAVGCLASSAGALVAASAVLRRPALFSAVQLVHPFLTPELILIDDSAPLAVTDRHEFGDPTRDDWVPEISPLAYAATMEPADLPRMWVRVGADDFRAPLWGVEAWLEALSAVHGSRLPTPVVQVGSHAHSGSADREEALWGSCLAMAWLLDALGRAEVATARAGRAGTG